jgi:hypothetical protein
MNIFEKIANEKIEEAMRNGEFDNLPGRGKPLDLEEDASIPAELRMAHRIMKNAGVSPIEVSLRKELNNLKEELAKTKDERKRAVLEREIRMMCLRISLQTESAKKRY